tara:strand:+ start:10527 stop:12452 length:1926 start_codon:yes stop_codon:yes gene_type:complete
MDIPKTTSGPANPALPSVLTLPAEVRNTVSELLFQRDEPVNLHNVRGYYAQGPPEPNPEGDDAEYAEAHTDYRPRAIIDTLPGRISNKEIEWLHKHNGKETCLARYKRRSAAWNRLLDAEMEDLKEFDHGLSEGFGLLKSCRQLYHETVGILYGSNTFLLTRMRSRHDRSKYNNDSSYHQLNHASVWFRNIGTQFGLLRRVSIDLSAVCDTRCPLAITNLEVLPILQHLWSKPLTLCELNFIHVGRGLIIGDREEPEEGVSPNAVHILNRFMALVVRRDILGIERFVRDGIFVRSVELRTPTSYGENWGGTIDYTSKGQSWARREFDIASNGGICWIAQHGVASIGALPRAVLGSILDDVGSAVENIVFDFNEGIIHGINLSLFREVSYFDGHAVLRAVCSRIPLVFHFRSTESITDFQRFQPLKDILLDKPTTQDWNEPNLVNAFCNIIKLSFAAKRGMAGIWLNFAIASHTTPTEPRINLSGIIDVLCRPNKCEISNKTEIRVALSHVDSGQAYGRASAFTMLSLREQLFLYFTDLLRQFPLDKWPYVPEVWVDKSGTLVDKISSPADFPCAHADSWSYLVGEESFMSIVLQVEKRYGARYSLHECRDHYRYQCMYCVWEMLRECMEQRWGTRTTATEV